MEHLLRQERERDTDGSTSSRQQEAQRGSRVPGEGLGQETGGVGVCQQTGYIKYTRQSKGQGHCAGGAGAPEETRPWPRPAL